MANDTLVINELFPLNTLTFQGEGKNIGMPCVFIRLGGCNLHCSFCFPAGSTVLMADWTQKPIEQLLEGDLVMSYSERGYKVSKVVKTYSRIADTVKVKTVSGDVVCTPDHVFHTNHHKSKQRKCEAKNLAGKWVKKSKLGNYALVSVTSDYLRGYLMGAYAGDGGTSSWGGHIKIYFQVTDKDFAERLLEIVNSYGHSCSITECKRKTLKGKTVYRVSSGIKSIEWIFDFPQNDEQARGYIAGFFDAEGSVGRNQLSLSQLDGKLLKRVQDMLTVFKFSAVWKTERNGMNKLVLNGVGECDRFVNTFTPAIARKSFKHRSDLSRQLEAVKVTDVSPSVPQEVFNAMTTIGNMFVNGFLVDQCDTWYTWDWKRADPKQELHPMAVKEVADWLLNHPAKPSAVVISGGEPLLQQKALERLTAEFLHPKHIWTEIETAGTIKPFNWALVRQYNVSPKLATSGNSLGKRYKPEVLDWFSASNRAIFKFVVTSENDFDEIDELAKRHRLQEVYVMPEGVDGQVIKERMQKLAGMVLARNYKLTTRLHVELYGNKRGI